MERGLLWLPLLVVFIWLAWSGWNEYRKVEAYKIWAENFHNAKFDIYSVLGIRDRQITWGKPTRKGMINLDNFSLNDVKEINLLVNSRVIRLNKISEQYAISEPQESGEFDSLPRGGKTALEFSFFNQEQTLQIPFTDIALAAKWCIYLQKQCTNNV